MQIAVIDDGIDGSLLPKSRILHDLVVCKNGQVRERSPEEQILTNHGTTCARIIAKYAPQAEFSSLRVFHSKKLRTSCDELVSAFSWCLAQRIPLVHVSAGSSLLNDYPKIRPVIARMLRQGQIVVAACSNATPYSMPACLGGVFGVAADPSLTGSSYIAKQSFGGAAFAASSRHVLESPLGRAFVTQVTNSYAAPTVTAALCNLLSPRAPFSMSMPRLYEEMTKDTRTLRFLRPDFIEDAVVVNLSGYPLLKHHFFFNCLREHTSMKSWADSGPWEHDLVLLPPRAPFDASHALGLFFERTTPFANLLYGGLLPPHFESSARDRLIWSEDALCGAAESPNGNSSPPACPVVYILGAGPEAVDMTCRLRDRFVKDDYQCACVSNHPYSYLYGLLYIPQTAAPAVGVADAAQRYDPDVILCCLSSPEYRPPLSEDVYEVLIADSPWDQSRSLSPNQCLLPVNFGESDIDELYQKICRHFS
ncbi:MAG: S8 family serine peptidase [Firmicutes bacterium]|nr:S8 family serine peptidase [Candidatus Fermentithermobacillaceae bacterium]